MRTVFSRLDNIFRREPPSQIGTTAELDHLRIPVRSVGVPGVEDQPRQGYIPSRPAMRDLSFWWHDQGRTQEDQFTLGHIPRSPATTGMLRGYMTPDPQRVNIPVPPHVAYGSLFQAPTSPYGYS